MEYGLFGIVSSLTATATFYPIDTLKTKKQANLPIKFNKSLYRGIVPELLSCVPSSFVYWYTYQKCRENNFTTTESAFISCATSNIVDTPFDIRKKRHQLGEQFLNKGNIYKYCFANVMSSIVYNLFYLNVLKKLKNDYKFNNWISIAGASTVSSTMSYVFDKWKTNIIYPNKVSYFKGLSYRLLYGNLFSGLYMTVFLYLSDNKVI